MIHTPIVLVKCTTKLSLILEGGFAGARGEAVRSLGHLFVDVLAAHPGRVALMEAGGGSEKLTYASLDAVLNQVANAALSDGLKQGDRVGIALRNRLEFPLAVFGLMRAGIVPALFNPRLAGDDLAFMIADAGCRAVITDEISASAFAASPARGALLHIHIGEAPARAASFAAWHQSAPAHDTTFNAGPSDVALQIYTSGSTGRPKGVLLPHRAQIEHFQDQRAFYDKLYTRPSVNLIAAPMFHKNGTGMLKTAFVMGGAAVIMPKFEPKQFLQNIQAYRVTTFAAVSAMLTMMMREEDLVREGDFSSLDAIMVGASPSGRVLLDRVAEVFGTRVLHMFGTTESGAVLGHHPEHLYTLDSCGIPMPGMSAKLLDPETGAEADMGELHIAGPGVALGYHNRPEAQGERFKGGWYATGDILSRDENGYYFFRGRIDDMFVCGGENVYPREVERQLLNHPQVSQAFVGPVPHEVKGQAPAAALIVTGAGVTSEEIRDFYLARAPAFSVPRFVLFCDAFPIAPTGKIDARAMQTLLEEAASGRRGAE